LDNCEIFYIKTNVHFFLDDNCEGDLAYIPGATINLSPENAFNLAEQMINDANHFYDEVNERENAQWNQDFHGLPITDHQCIPVRYVLCGVQVHCDTDAQDIPNLSDNRITPYFTNEDSEINVFVTNLSFQEVSGFARLGRNLIAVETIGPGLFNHEAGHAFNLRHTQRIAGDGCDDTWGLQWMWDWNGDGNSDATGTACWSNSPTFQGQDACDTDIFNEEHPCCFWGNQSNNVMTASSSWGPNYQYAAMTTCQMGRILDNINQRKCDFLVEGNGTCPPIKAVIGTLPNTENNQTTDCPACFYLTASDNEDQYEVEILNEFGNVLIYTGIIEGTAGKYCINPRIQTSTKKPVWPNGLAAGQTYTIKLTVHNDCNDSHAQLLSFTLPKPCHPTTISQPGGPGGSTAIASITISPNPSTSFIQASIDAKETGILRIYGVHNDSNSSYGLIWDSSVLTANEQIIDLNISNWHSGMNSLIFELNDQIYLEQIIKQ